MINEFRYRPPFKYLFLGIGGILAASIFGGVTLEKGEIWFRIITFIFFVLNLALGIGFLALFINKFNVGKLKIGDDFIEISGRWKNRTKLNFTEIKSIGEIDTYDQVIEIKSENGFNLIEKQWMKSKEFDIVREKLIEWANKNTFSTK
ncbi:hypothetical protein IMCC3317_45900 [Kordia antarctica]|uniref:DUF5673 domain-containing protein n=1 Tax=Kordia antarctica TaxID=1218801 RepID=A0A7L4ZRA7_9FLAO|nr:hypothetical protein [Kordia antarctica]QHI39185.1 hypothetical protein IMCC3317_45900 [Kordia antarctica]